DELLDLGRREPRCVGLDLYGRRCELTERVAWGAGNLGEAHHCHDQERAEDQDAKTLRERGRTTHHMLPVSPCPPAIGYGASRSSSSPRGRASGPRQKVVVTRPFGGVAGPGVRDCH